MPSRVERRSFITSSVHFKEALFFMCDSWFGAGENSHPCGSIDPRNILAHFVPMPKIQTSLFANSIYSDGEVRGGDRDIRKCVHSFIKLMTQSRRIETRLRVACLSKANAMLRKQAHNALASSNEQTRCWTGIKTGNGCDEVVFSGSICLLYNEDDSCIVIMVASTIWYNVNMKANQKRPTTASMWRNVSVCILWRVL